MIYLVLSLCSAILGIQLTDSESTITKNFSNQLESFGITPSSIHRNLPVAKLVDISIQKNEGMLTTTGSLAVKTGKYTGRSPDDRYIIFDDETHDNVDW